ncbi:hypothetical protein CRV24_003838 [Beauveria bassiana]|nr:hypothetical protein CRV24_003838 [Beauveria bassiana]
MDLLSACESLAANVLEHDVLDMSDMYIAESDTKHWMTAFNLTHAEAIDEITKWRSDYTRESLSQSAWDTIKESDAASGFTKESYEFSLTRGRTIKQSHATGADDTGILHSPQYRAPSASFCFQPLQNEYPVRYFFYGTLADGAVLARVIGVSDADSIRYEPAVLSRALLTSWAGKYRGVVDGGPDDKVQGVVYWVKSREEEEALRIYETAKYEVVRCGVHVEEEMDACMGLTFRLI